MVPAEKESMQRPVAQQPAARDAWHPPQIFALLLSYFALFGIIIGAQGVLWADIKMALQMSEGIFGTAQLASPLVSVGLLLLAGQLSASFGKKRLAFISLLLLAGALLALAGAGGLLVFVISLLIAGTAHGLFETAINGATLDWERATGRGVMNVMHAGFSGGAVLGAIATGLLLGADWDYVGVLLLLVALCLVSFVATAPVRYPPVDRSEVDSGAPSQTLRLIWGRPSLRVLALLCLMGIVGESVAFLWSVIYLRDLGAATVVSGAAFAMFNAAMFVGRLLNAPLVERKGPRFSLILSGCGLILANVLLMLPGGVSLAVVAFVVLGLAMAGVVPTVLSVAAGLVPGNSGAVAGGIMAAAYAGFIVCPPLIGWVTEFFSLRAALLSVGLSGVGILVLVGRVAEFRPR
jgi:MFS family permease